MKLILMRHGQAGYENADNTPVTTDADRQLTAHGRKQAAQTAQVILQHYQPDLCVVSPYIRAKQTLQAFSAVQPKLPVVELTDIIPDADPKKALHKLLDIVLEVDEARKAQSISPLQCVLVVCHMPIVAKIAGLLTAQTPEAYALAEARVFETELIAADLGEEIDRVLPNEH